MIFFYNNIYFAFVLQNLTMNKSDCRRLHTQIRTAIRFLDQGLARPLDIQPCLDYCHPILSSTDTPTRQLLTPVIWWHLLSFFNPRAYNVFRFDHYRNIVHDTMSEFYAQVSHIAGIQCKLVPRDLEWFDVQCVDVHTIMTELQPEDTFFSLPKCQTHLSLVCGEDFMYKLPIVHNVFGYNRDIMHNYRYFMIRVRDYCKLMQLGYLRPTNESLYFISHDSQLTTLPTTLSPGERYWIMYDNQPHAVLLCVIFCASGCRILFFDTVNKGTRYSIVNWYSNNLPLVPEQSTRVKVANMYTIQSDSISCATICMWWFYVCSSMNNDDLWNLKFPPEFLCFSQSSKHTKIKYSINGVYNSVAQYHNLLALAILRLKIQVR